MPSSEFDISKFNQFSSSTKLDGNYTGLYQGKVIRIFEENQETVIKLLSSLSNIPYLVSSKLFYVDKNQIVVEHEKLENITYYTEWTKNQKVIAAQSIVKLQLHLTKNELFLNDPHAFNLTFKYVQPIYFDFGSIQEGKINPAWWFLKCFCGWTEKDYWDSILNINKFQKLMIALRMIFSKSPYSYLLTKLSRFNQGKIKRNLISVLKSKNKFAKFIRKIISFFPFIFSDVSNWSDYEQKDPELDFNTPRNKSILTILKKFKPEKLLDIGANRGAFSLLALEQGTKEIIAIDLDNYSVDCLIKEIKNKKITTAKIDIMDYPEKPGYYKSYRPAHERLYSDFSICLAVVHHVCYFGNRSFEEFAERLNRFTKKMLVVEFVPYEDIHLTGKEYKGKDRSWYTLENFIKAFKNWFPGEHEIFESTPTPRLLVRFSK